MAKIKQHKEKRLRNEAYADQYRKKNDREAQKRAADKKRKGGTYGNWCRIKGHPPECGCVYK